MSTNIGSSAQWNRRTALKLGAATTAALGAATTAGLSFGSPPPAAAQRADPVEPGAGQWKTWLLRSGSQLRPPPPPDSAAEIAAVRAAAGRRDPATLERISFWDAGSAAYRWNEIALDLANVKNNLSASISTRAMALMNAAIYDGAVAAWAAKYTYNRPRPSAVDASVTTLVAVPSSPSYPSEHAVAATAAATVLGHLFPEAASSLAQLAEEAALTRVIAGVQYPSDVAAGVELGRAVAALAIERANTDNFGLQWEGTIPTAPGLWTGPSAPNAEEALWKPWVLSSPSQIRPGPPPAADSPQMAVELAEVKDFPRTPRTTGLALAWQYGQRGTPNTHIFWDRHASRLLFEDRLDANLPHAARVYLLTLIAWLDTWIATQDTKFHYWGIRPFQLDPTLTTVFPTPPFPSYPSNRASFNPAAAMILGHFFPREAATLLDIADEICESAIWAGIHFRSDLTSAGAMADAVVQMTLERGI